MCCPVLRELIEMYQQTAQMTAVLPAIFSSLNPPQVQTILCQGSSLRRRKNTHQYLLTYEYHHSREQEINPRQYSEVSQVIPINTKS